MIEKKTELQEQYEILVDITGTSIRWSVYEYNSKDALLKGVNEIEKLFKEEPKNYKLIRKVKDLIGSMYYIEMYCKCSKCNIEDTYELDYPSVLKGLIPIYTHMCPTVGEDIEYDVCNRGEPVKRKV